MPRASATERVAWQRRGSGVPVLLIVLATLLSAALVVAAVWYVAPLAVDQERPVVVSTARDTSILSGQGIDLSGRKVSTEAVRAFLANRPLKNAVQVVQVPSGAIIRLDATIEIPANTILRGGGELRWTGGIKNSAALSVVGANVEISGVTMTNPKELGAPTGERNYGIEIKASDVRILGNHIERFQNGIAVRQGGEYHDIVIANNRVKDVVGVGATAGAGEDRGDGIVVWGAQASVTGNVVNAKAGTDARVGIHTEDTRVGNAQDAPHSASMVTITGNVVYGPFRRSIVSENVSNTAITANTVADATWWGIAVILQSHDSVVTGNTIVYTRRSDDEPGQNYNPRRAPIMVYGGVERATIANNSIVTHPGSDAAAFVVLQSAGSKSPTDVTIDGNSAHNDGGRVADGLITQGPTVGLSVSNNRFTGFSGIGIKVTDSRDFSVDNNRLRGSDAQQGVHVTGAATGRVTGNIVSGVRSLVNVPSGVEARNNQAG